MGPAITAFACRAWWSRKTTGNKMQRNNVRKITGRATEERAKMDATKAK